MLELHLPPEMKSDRLGPTSSCQAQTMGPPYFQADFVQGVTPWAVFKNQCLIWIQLRSECFGKGCAQNSGQRVLVHRKGYFQDTHIHQGSVLSDRLVGRGKTCLRFGVRKGYGRHAGNNPSRILYHSSHFLSILWARHCSVLYVHDFISSLFLRPSRSCQPHLQKEIDSERWQNTPISQICTPGIWTQVWGTPHGHHQMAKTEIKLITFFVAEDGEAVYSQQKQDLELTVAQIISFS